MNRFALAVVSIPSVLVVLGCGSGVERFSVARTEGVVLCNGVPVENAQVYFEPLITGKSAKVGKQAFAFTNAEGAFVLSTYGRDDGAVVGKHRVRVGGDGSVKCDCSTNSEKDIMEVEIVAGETNSFEVELPPKQQKQPTQQPLKTSLGAAADDADSKLDEE
jgi:hypothetical protein